jgi:hypothetical protein
VSPIPFERRQVGSRAVLDSNSGEEKNFHPCGESNPWESMKLVFILNGLSSSKSGFIPPNLRHAKQLQRLTGQIINVMFHL